MSSGKPVTLTGARPGALAYTDRQYVMTEVRPTGRIDRTGQQHTGSDTNDDKGVTVSKYLQLTLMVQELYMSATAAPALAARNGSTMEVGPTHRNNAT